MKNKIIAIILTVVFVFGVTGCAKSENDHVADKPKIINVVESGYDYAVFVDAKTGVMYVEVADSGVCVMVNPDGTPKIYGEDNGR